MLAELLTSLNGRPEGPKIILNPSLALLYGTGQTLRRTTDTVGPSDRNSVCVEGDHNSDRPTSMNVY
jgi:hypothetical protein